MGDSAELAHSTATPSELDDPGAAEQPGSWPADGSEPDVAPEPTTGASECEGAACDCPPPRDGNCSAGPEPEWSRNPETGACCAFDRACQIPEGWSAFPSRQECESSCRCGDVTPNDFSMVDALGVAVFSRERTSLECWCGGDGASDCASTFADTATSACAARDSSVALLDGCGMLGVTFFSGYSSSARVFDAASGTLIGTASMSDVPRRPCNVYEVVAGVEFDCPEAVECLLCDGDQPRLGGCE